MNLLKLPHITHLYLLRGIILYVIWKILFLTYNFKQSTKLQYNQNDLSLSHCTLLNVIFVKMYYDHNFTSVVVLMFENILVFAKFLKYIYHSDF